MASLSLVIKAASIEEANAFAKARGLPNLALLKSIPNGGDVIGYVADTPEHREIVWAWFGEPMPKGCVPLPEGTLLLYTYH